MNHGKTPYSLVKLHELSEKDLIEQVKTRMNSKISAESGPTLSYMEYAMEILNSKWTLDILFVIAHKKIHRYSQIQKQIPGISSLMLSRTLKKLEHHRIVKRIQYNERPVRVEYYLTELGDSLRYVLWTLTLWGMDVYEATESDFPPDDDLFQDNQRKETKRQ